MTAVTAQPRITKNKSDNFFRDSIVLAKRSAIHTFRIPDLLIGSTISPIMFVLVFRYVFGGAIQTGETSYINFMMAGIFVQTITFGSMATGIGLADDMQKGVVDRFRSIPMKLSTMLVGRTLADQIRNVAALIVMFVVGLAVGFRPEWSFFGLVLTPILILLFGFVMSWVMAAASLFLRTVDAVNQVGFMLIFPLTFASSAFAPTESMPSWLRGFAANQPLNQIIEASRALLLGNPAGKYVALSLMWSVLILLIAFAVASWKLKRLDR